MYNLTNNRAKTPYSIPLNTLPLHPKRINMEEWTVQSLTIDSVRRYVENLPNVATSKHCILARFSDVAAGRPETLYQEPIRVDALVFWLCTEGEMVLTYDLEEVHIKAGSFALIPPKSIIQKQHVSDKYSGYVMLVTQAYMSECHINLKKVMALMLERMPQRVIHLTPIEQQRLEYTFELIFATLATDAASLFREDVERSQIEMATYLACEFFSLHAHDVKTAPSITNRAEEYFRRFIKELSEHYLERQSVSFYADRLCISSRYLTTIVRRVSGYAVTDWMNRYIITEAKYLLKYSEMSIQEIAYKLNFPNQSFFGKYFKQHTGKSPSNYRRQ